MPDQNFHALGVSCDLVPPLHNGNGGTMNEVENSLAIDEYRTYATTRFGLCLSETNRDMIWIVLPMLLTNGEYVYEAVQYKLLTPSRPEEQHNEAPRIRIINL